MSQEHVEIVREMLEGWANGDFRVGTDRLDRNVVFIASPDFPEFGVFVGPEEIRQFMNRFLEQWERLTIEAKHLEAVGDTVLAHVVQHQKGRASGLQGDVSTFMLVTFRGRKIVRIEHVLHRSEALEAVGLSEQDAHAGA